MEVQGSRHRSGYLRARGEGSREVLGGLRVRARMDDAVDQGRRVEAAAREVVPWRHAQRQRQLSRSARANGPPQPGRIDLGRRARRPADADVLRPPSRGLPVRERAEVARRQERRSRRDVHAARARAGHRDAGLGAHRRGAQRRVRWIQRRGVARSHQRPASLGARDRGRRLSPRPTSCPSSRLSTPRSKMRRRFEHVVVLQRRRGSALRREHEGRTRPAGTTS